MRKIILLASLGLAFAGCANDRDRQMATLDCQKVGITQGASDYDTCMQAYISQHREKALNDNIHNAINPYREDPRIPHFEIY